MAHFDALTASIPCIRLVSVAVSEREATAYFFYPYEVTPKLFVSNPHCCYVSTLSQVGLEDE